jgi:hypothetical protein
MSALPSIADPLDSLRERPEEGPPSSTPRVLAEITSGKGLTLLQAANRYPATRGTGRLHSSTMWRWIKKGICAADGRRVFLEAARISNRYLTSEPALLRFAAAQSEAEQARAEQQAEAVPAPRTQTQRKRAADRAAAELAKLGL